MKGRLLLSAAVVFAAGCSSNTAMPVAHSSIRGSVRNATSEVLVAYDNSAADVEAWNVTSSGGTQPSVLASPGFTSNVIAVAGAGSFGSGEEVVLAGSSPSSESSLYDLSTNTRVEYNPASWGPPVDVVSIIGGSSLTLYADGSYETMPFDRSMGIHKTECTSILETATAITADTYGNVYIQGTGPGFAGVVELAQATQTCAPLQLKPQKGTAAGITIDPETNDLIVGDNPHLCNGAADGRLIVYAPPYSPASGTVHRLAGVGCAGLFRIDSGATGTTYLFMLDADSGTPQIDQLECCDMMTLEGVYSGGNPSAPTTLPNTLPNG